MSPAALLLLCALPAAGAQLAIRAEVSRTEVALDDQIVLSVTVSGPRADLPEPRLPPLPDFGVYSSGRSHNLSFVNGRLSSSVTHTYVLAPRFVGRRTVGPISAGEGAETVSTEPIELQVLRPEPGGAPAPEAPRAPAPRPDAQAAPEGRDLFVEASLDKDSAFVNEAVTLTVRFYTSLSLLGSPQYQPPKTEGFLSEDLPPERHGNTTAEGRAYYFSEVRTALFPVQPGRLAVGPATVKAQVRRDLAIDPFAPDFFDRFFSGGLSASRTREVRSEPLTLEAKPLPESGKPPGFSGAVGRFSVAAETDRAEAKVGEAVTMTVTVSGTGNLKSISEPLLPPLADFRVYETVSSLNLDTTGGSVKGSKVFRTVLVPRVSGELAVPPVAFSYFDPEAREYRWSRSLPLAVRVSPSPGAASPAGGAPAPAGAPSLSAVSEDIRYLRTDPPPRTLSRLLGALSRGGGLHALPFLAFLLALGLNLREASLASDPAGRRARAALSAARERLGAAGREADPSARAGLLGEALRGYLSDKLGRPRAGLTLRRALEVLRDRRPGPGEGTLEELRAVWEELEARRYAPPGAAPPAPGLEERLGTLLEALEGGLAP